MGEEGYGGEQPNYCRMRGIIYRSGRGIGGCFRRGELDDNLEEKDTVTSIVEGVSKVAPE